MFNTVSTKKRNRVPKSCSVCRAKKIKCDRNHPVCGVCLRNDTGHLCQYEASSWVDPASDATGSAAYTTVLDEYNSSRLRDAAITENPYKSAARIPIAFIPSTLANTTLKKPLGTPDDESRRKKSKTGQTTVPVDYVESLQSQIESLKTLIVELSSSINRNRVTNHSGTTLKHYLSPQSLVDFAGSPLLDQEIPMARNIEYINFYDGHETTYVRRSRVMYHGVFTHHSLFSKDNFLKLGRYSMRAKTSKKDSKRKKGVNNFGASDGPPLKREIFPLSISVEDIKSVLHQQIEAVLPNRKIIWLLLKRFFAFVYPFHPYVIKEEFIENISRIVGPESYLMEPAVIDISGRSDFAHLGVLLIFMRMAYLSILNNKAASDPTEKLINDSLLANPVSHNLIAIAQLCLNQFRILRKADIFNFQLALYLRLYNRNSPEYDGNSDTTDIQIFTGLIFQIAYAVGLHEDPLSQFDDNNRHLRRKLWYCLRTLDLEECISTGIPLRLKDCDSNVQLPDYISEKPGSFDDVMENRIIKVIHDDYHLQQPLTEIANMAIAFRPARLDLLLEKMSALETLAISKYKTLSSIIGSKEFVDDYTKSKCIKRYLEIKCVLMKLNYHILVHYERKGDYVSAEPILLKILELNQDLLANFDFKSMSAKTMSNGNDFFYYEFQAAFMVSFCFMFGLYLRAEKYSLEVTDLARRDKLRFIMNMALESLKFHLYAESRTALTCYTTWRFIAGWAEILNTLEAEGLFSCNGQLDRLPDKEPPELPQNNILEGLSDDSLSKVVELIDRGAVQYTAANTLDDYNEYRSANADIYEKIINDPTWKRSKHEKMDTAFYANLSNHNISYDTLKENFEDLFNDIIDF